VLVVCPLMGSVGVKVVAARDENFPALRQDDLGAAEEVGRGLVRSVKWDSAPMPRSGPQMS
jgi:hypothetical protein